MDTIPVLGQPISLTAVALLLLFGWQSIRQVKGAYKDAEEFPWPKSKGFDRSTYVRARAAIQVFFFFVYFEAISSLYGVVPGAVGALLHLILSLGFIIVVVSMMLSAIAVHFARNWGREKSDNRSHLLKMFRARGLSFRRLLLLSPAGLVLETVPEIIRAARVVAPAIATNLAAIVSSFHAALSRSF